MELLRLSYRAGPCRPTSSPPFPFRLDLLERSCFLSISFISGACLTSGSMSVGHRSKPPTAGSTRGQCGIDRRRVQLRVVARADTYSARDCSSSFSHYASSQDWLAASSGAFGDCPSCDYLSTLYGFACSIQANRSCACDTKHCRASSKCISPEEHFLSIPAGPILILSLRPN